MEKWHLGAAKTCGACGKFFDDPTECSRQTPDQRTPQQQRDDMINYGPCPFCLTARTVRLSEHAGTMNLSVICPNCDDDLDA